MPAPSNASEPQYEPYGTTGRIQGGLLPPGAPLALVRYEVLLERSDLSAFLRRVAEPWVVQEPASAASPNQPGFFWNTMARPQAADADEPGGITAGVVDPARIAGLVVSTSVLVWAARSTGLTFALLASVPLWRNLDPLYVLPTGTGTGDATAAGDENDLPAPRSARWLPGGRLIASMDTDE
jgi:hypothetical protein